MRYLLIISFVFYGTAILAQESAQELVAAAISYHDPTNSWQAANFVLGLSESRPNNEPRKTTVSLDNAAGIVCIRREEDGKKITRHIAGDSCSYDINGSTTVSTTEIEKYKLNDERSLILRNFYLYLWGLPMKLMDSGTNIDPDIQIKLFNGQETKAVRVTYDAAVGSDVWYFYFHPVSNEMVGYQFFHDEALGDGEYITLSGIEEISGLKLPKSRTWYSNSDSTMLGTDQLIHAFMIHHH